MNLNGQPMTIEQWRERCCRSAQRPADVPVKFVEKPVGIHNAWADTGTVRIHLGAYTTLQRTGWNANTGWVLGEIK